jgi:hypothetical protein
LGLSWCSFGQQFCVREDVPALDRFFVSCVGPASNVHRQQALSRFCGVSRNTVIRLSINPAVLEVDEVGTVTAVGSAWPNGSSSIFSHGVGVMRCPGLLTWAGSQSGHM